MSDAAPAGANSSWTGRPLAELLPAVDGWPRAGLLADPFYALMALVACTKNHVRGQLGNSESIGWTVDVKRVRSVGSDLVNEIHVTGGKGWYTAG